MLNNNQLLGATQKLPDGPVTWYLFMEQHGQWSMTSLGRHELKYSFACEHASDCFHNSTYSLNEYKDGDITRRKINVIVSDN